jgi:photosystem II stability/assembly factor-like uncharacterized protein
MRRRVRMLSAGRSVAAVATACVLCAVLLAVASAANVNVSKSGWAWGNPTPQGRTLNAIAFAGSVGYAVGSGGTVLSTADAGHTWAGLTTGTAANLTHVQVLAPSTIVVGGGGGCVTRISTNGGQVFKRIFNVAESGCSESVAAFSFTSPTTGFLLLGNGSVEETADGGETFSRKTGIPGTAASSGGGSLVGTNIHFINATIGLAIVNSSAGVSSAYRTPDGGVSWTPVALPAGAHVTSLYFVDEKDAYAIGPETFLSSTDGGETWTAQAIGKGNSFNSIDCSSATTCVMTVTAGNQLVETTDGGATDVVKTTSSSLIYGAAYASPLQIVAVGASGATVLSADGGATFTPASADVGGQYGKLRRGPGAMVLAPGSGGEIAISTNDGQTWQTVATQTSQDLVDAAFATTTLGYALDAKGGLQRTTNGGASWQTLNPGTTRPAAAVATPGANTVLLIGPVGINRAVGGGAFAPIGGAVSKARLSDYDIAGSAVFAFGVGGHALLRSTNEGAKWRALTLPLARKAKRSGRRRIRASAGVAIRSIAFTNAQGGLLLDTQGRLWLTRNGGKRWTEAVSTGTSDGVQIAFATPRNGFLTVRAFDGHADEDFVLRTTDGGHTWHPQEIASGLTPYDGLVTSGASEAALLNETTGVNGEALDREFFTTSTGGDVSGTAERLALGTSRTSYSKRKLKAVHDSVRITGTLAGANGGEEIVVSRRSVAGGSWQHKVVVAGANGGSFTTTWRITKSSVFVAQWAGDSGRPGQGSTPLKVIVR